MDTYTHAPIKNSREEHTLRWIKGPNVLDLGCSGAHFRFEDKYWLHGHIRRVFPTTTWGLELDQANVDQMRSLGLTNVVQGDAQDFVLDREFDTVVAGELIEHVERPGDLLRTAARHLKPDGRIVLTTPYPFSLAYVTYAFVKYPKTCSNSEHVAWFCPTTLTQLAERCGLTVTHWDLVTSHRVHARGSFLHKSGSAVLRVLDRFLPRRISGNHLLMVLEKAGD